MVSTVQYLSGLDGIHSVSISKKTLTQLLYEQILQKLMCFTCKSSEYWNRNHDINVHHFLKCFWGNLI